jgi:hypothetical protein
MCVLIKQAKPLVRLALGLCLLGLLVAGSLGWHSLAAVAVSLGWQPVAVSSVLGVPVKVSPAKPLRVRSDESAPHQVKVVSTSAAPGSEASVPIAFQADGTESRIHFSLRFPAAALHKARITLADELSMAELSIDESQLAAGKLGVEIALPAGVVLTAGEHKLLTVSFTIARNAGAASLPLEFGDEPVSRGVWNGKAQSVSTGYVNGLLSSVPGLEGDVAPRPANGNGSLSVADWAQVGRFAVGLDAVAEGSEFQRADCAPRASAGDGQISLADWVQAGRYSTGLDEPAMAGGPSAPVVSITTLHSVLAPEQQTRTVRVVPVTFNRGQQGNAMIELNSLGNEFAVGFALNFDPTQLNFIRAVAGTDAAGANVIVNSNDAANGRIIFNLSLPFGQKFAAGARQVGVITFAVPNTSTLNSTTLGFSNGSVVDEQAATLPTTFTAGVITLTPEISQTPRLVSLNPSQALTGSGNFTLTVNGVNLSNGSVVRVNGEDRVTEFVSNAQLRAGMIASDTEDTGTLSITVRTAEGVITNALALNVVNPAPTITSITPNSATLNGAAFAMTVTGTNFVPGAVVKIGATNRLTNYLNSAQLNVQVPASALNTAGTFDVTVTNPPPGGGVSNAVTFTVSAPKPIPRISTISPATKQGGTEGFTLTVNGSGYVRESVVRWNGADRVTTYVSATQLTAAITAEDIANFGTASVTVFNSPPGGGVSAAATFTITQPPNPVPTLASLNPPTITAGTPSFVLALIGTNFVPNSVVRVAGQDRQTTFVSATELRVTIAAADVANGGTLALRVFNPTPGGGPSNELTLTITFAAPTITSISPVSAVAGGPAFLLTVVGTNFAPGTVVKWNGENRVTTILSVTELTANITAADIAARGSATITVMSAAGTSAAVSFAINEAARPIPRITALNPSSVEAGGPSLTLAVTGTNFVSDSVVRWNGQPRPTTFANSTQLTAQISAADLATIGTAQVTVFTPPAGGGESNNLPFNVTAPPNPVPAITSLDPTTVVTGSPATTLTINGTGFIPASVVKLNGDPRPTTYVSGTQVTAQLNANDLAVAGTAAITVTNPAPGGGTSFPRTLNISNLAPTVTSLNPSVVAEGSAAQLLTVTGTNFVPGAQVLVNGQARLTTFVNATTVTTQLTVADQATATTLNIQVSNPAPGGGVSNIVTLPVRKRNPIPRITNLNPTSVTAGANGFSLLVNGANFVQGSVVRWNGVDRPTDFGSESLLVAQIPASDLAGGQNVTITVFNPLPGGGMSGGAPFQVVNPAPRITSINPDTAAAGSGAVALIVNGANFVANSAVRFNGVDIPTTFITSSQLSGQVPASAVATGGAYVVTVVNPTPGGGASGALNFTVTNPLPTATAILPDKVATGSPAFMLTVVGTGFVPSSVARVNGQERQTVYVAPSQVTAMIPAADIATAGTLQITVTNPAPGGGSTAALSLAVVNEPNPVPALSALSPTSAFSDSQAFTLALTGTGFIGSSRVTWNGTERPTAFVSTTQLTAQISATDLVNTGTINIAVVNPPAVGGGGGTSNALTFTILQPPAPVPVITAAGPNSVIAGGNGITLLVTGQNFTPSSVGRWNGADRPTDVIGATQLTVQLSATDIASAGQGVLTVFNPATTGGGGGASNEIVIRIIATPVANITLAPANPTTDDEIVLQLSGNWPNGCVPQSPQVSLLGNEIRINTANPAQACITVVTPWSLAVPLGKLAAPGNYTARVIHTSVEGVAEIGRLAFSVGNGRPVISTIVPGQVISGAQAFTLTVNGTGFANGATVLLNGAPRETAYTRPTLLTALITEADVAMAGVYAITVVNPPANGLGGGTSNAVPLTVNNAQPLIMLLSPGRATVGSGAFTLTLTGIGFVPGALVRWNGGDRPTTFIDRMTLTAQIPAQDIAVQGTANITVFNPAPGGGNSTPLSLVIDSPPICQTACFQAPQYYLLNMARLPNGSVMIGGVNFNSPVTIQDALADVRRALQGGRSVLQALNAEFVAAQISVIQAGGTNTSGILNGSLRCYSLNFDPRELDNGYVITVDSTIGDLFGQARAAIMDGRTTDQLRIAQTLDLLNGNLPTSRCGAISSLIQ